MVVLDASALLASIFEEPGMLMVRDRLHGAAMSAVNYAEVVSKLLDRGSHQTEVRDGLSHFNLDVRPFDRAQALESGILRVATRSRGLSFGDRACLALAHSLGATVLTADRAWAGLEGVELIR